MSRASIFTILERARWAPSGDNTQPWFFEITGETSVRVIGFDTRDHVLYDFEGHPSHMAHGALLETIRIAASELEMEATWTIHSHSDDSAPVYNVEFKIIPGLQPDPLAPFIESRVVQRRPMRTKPLTEKQRNALTASVGDNFEVRLFESLVDRFAIARLLWKSAYLRLTCPEAYLVHRDVIEWGAQFSKDRIPEQAVGVNHATAILMRWVMQSWPRVVFFNRYLLGTILPRVQLDALPALMCASHVLILPKHKPACLGDWLVLGQAMQRFWLTTTSVGLHLQPEMTPVIFRWYARYGKTFTAEHALNEKAIGLSSEFEAICGAVADDPFGFFARVGESDSPSSRSIRQNLDDLIRLEVNK